MQVEPVTNDSSDLVWLLEGMSRSQDLQQSPQRVAADFAKEYAAPLLGLLLIISGSVLLYVKYLPWQWLIWHSWLHELIQALGEAIVIAGILMAFVDEAVKRRLIRESSKSIFVHMIGFDHEPELKERIKTIALDTRLYQRDYKLICAIQPFSESSVKITMSKELEILALRRNS